MDFQSSASRNGGSSPMAWTPGNRRVLGGRRNVWSRWLGLEPELSGWLRTETFIGVRPLQALSIIKNSGLRSNLQACCTERWMNPNLTVRVTILVTNREDCLTYLCIHWVDGRELKLSPWQPDTLQCYPIGANYKLLLVLVSLYTNPTDPSSQLHDKEQCKRLAELVPRKKENQSKQHKGE